MSKHTFHRIYFQHINFQQPKEFVGYFAKIVSDIIEVSHNKLFVKT